MIANLYKQGLPVSNIARSVTWSKEKVLKLIKDLDLKEYEKKQRIFIKRY